MRLAAAGYETAAIGKMHFAPLHAEHGFETMRLCEHLHAQGIDPVTKGADLDDLDEYHHWLVGEGIPDWRFEDGTPDSGFRTTPRRGFPEGPEVHPTGWVEREVTSLPGSAGS